MISMYHGLYTALLLLNTIAVICLLVESMRNQNKIQKLWDEITKELRLLEIENKKRIGK